MKKFLHSMYTNAMQLNKRNILDFIKENQNESILDLGCDDGIWTTALGRAARSSKLFGIEIVPEALEEAISRGIEAKKSNLSDDFPYPTSSIDVVHANQVIEHVPDIDHFMSETYRVLRPGGKVVISTENASSICNIFASLMGWQIFSLTNFSSLKGGIGNPLALHSSTGKNSSWTHKTILNYCGLRDLFKVYKFDEIEIKGSGYFPLPAWVGRIDVRHAHFLALSARKAK
jgi:SAM-dependent methyltransferase